MKRLKVVFFGTPDFAVPTLDILHNHSLIDLKCVVSMPDRKAGRGQQLKSPEVIEFAKGNKIPYFQTENINKEEEFLKKLKDESIDAFIVLAFAQFLSDKVLNIPSKGPFNIHTSILPKYRGAAPIQYALLNGDTETGVSIQKMVKKMDAGDLVHSSPIKIHPEETGGQLYTKLKFQAALSCNDFLNNLFHDKIEYSKQDESRVCFAPTLKKDDGLVDFQNDNYETIKNKVRALNPWPGTYCFLGKKRLKIFHIEPAPHALKPGEVQTTSKEIFVGSKNQALRLCEIQLEGKKRGTDTELLNGYKEDIILHTGESV